MDTRELPRRFLDAFSAILSHSNYSMVLDAASRMKARCGRCAATCPVYQVSGEQRDIPCERSELLLQVYRRYFTLCRFHVAATERRSLDKGQAAGDRS